MAKNRCGQRMQFSRVVTIYPCCSPNVAKMRTRQNKLKENISSQLSLFNSHCSKEAHRIKVDKRSKKKQTVLKRQTKKKLIKSQVSILSQKQLDNLPNFSSAEAHQLMVISNDRVQFHNTDTLSNHCMETNNPSLDKFFSKPLVDENKLPFVDNSTNAHNSLPITETTSTPAAGKFINITSVDPENPDHLNLSRISFSDEIEIDKTDQKEHALNCMEEDNFDSPQIALCDLKTANKPEKLFSHSNLLELGIEQPSNASENSYLQQMITRRRYSILYKQKTSISTCRPLQHTVQNDVVFNRNHFSENVECKNLSSNISLKLRYKRESSSKKDLFESNSVMMNSNLEKISEEIENIQPTNVQSTSFLTERYNLRKTKYRLQRSKDPAESVSTSCINGCATTEMSNINNSKSVNLFSGYLDNNSNADSISTKENQRISLDVTDSTRLHRKLSTEQSLSLFGSPLIEENVEKVTLRTDFVNTSSRNQNISFTFNKSLFNCSYDRSVIESFMRYMSPCPKNLHTKSSFSDFSWQAPDYYAVDDEIILQRDSYIPQQVSQTNTVFDFDISARRHILNACGICEPIEFEQFLMSRYSFSDDKSDVKKIGEGVYGEVFKTKLLSSADMDESVVVLKIVPIEGSCTVNDERQKTFEEIYPEIVISMEMSLLCDPRSEKNYSPNFLHLSHFTCVQGEYPELLLSLWDEFDERLKQKRKKSVGSENDRPDFFSSDQLYIVFEFEHGGIDLEKFHFQNAEQAISILTQVALSLAVAENHLNFEHRDLHVGNILVNRTENKYLQYKYDDNYLNVPTFGVKASIIDFTLSRLTTQRCGHEKAVEFYSDLSQDPTLFDGNGDYQFEIYRLMRNATDNDWEQFIPYTNVLWLHYLSDKLIQLKCTKKWKKDIDRLYQFRDRLLNYTEGAEEIVSKDILFVDFWHPEQISFSSDSS